jgi:hypothetical protein
MNLNDEIYNALRAVPNVTDEQAKRAAAAYATLEDDTRREFNAVDKRLTKMETLMQVSLAFHLLTIGGIFALFFK